MKRVVLVLFYVCIIFLLTSCRNEDSSYTNNQQLIRVGFSQADFTESDWRIANTESMRQALSQENGFDLIIIDAQNDPDKQLADVANLIEQGVDYILIATVQEFGWERVLQQAKRC